MNWARCVWAQSQDVSLDQNCQAHDVKNLFVADAAPFVTQSDKTTLSIMALSWRTQKILAGPGQEGRALGKRNGYRPVYSDVNVFEVADHGAVAGFVLRAIRFEAAEYAKHLSRRNRATSTGYAAKYFPPQISIDATHLCEAIIPGGRRFRRRHRGWRSGIHRSAHPARIRIIN